MFFVNCVNVLSKTRPVLTVVSSLISTVTLIDRGYEPSFMSLLLPCFMLQYMPGLIANSVVKRFQIVPFCALLNLLGVILGMILYKQKVLLVGLQDLIVISKALTYMDLMSAREKTNELITYLIVKELTTIFVRKQLLAKSFRIRPTEGFNSALCIGVLFAARKYELNEMFVVTAVFAVPVIKILFSAMEVIRSRLTHKKEEKTKKDEVKKEEGKKTRKGARKVQQ